MVSDWPSRTKRAHTPFSTTKYTAGSPSAATSGSPQAPTQQDHILIEAMASSAAAAPDSAPPVPPPPEEPPSDAPESDSPKKKPRIAVTEAQRNLDQLRDMRAQQRKVLSDLRRQARQQRRRITALNKKASKVSLQELMEITCIKHQMLLQAGEVEPPSDSDKAAPSAPLDPGTAFAAVAAIAAKQKVKKVT